jgi:hypothetical protein
MIQNLLFTVHLNKNSSIYSLYKSDFHLFLVIIQYPNEVIYHGVEFVKFSIVLY